jgi:hypothetical protein
MQLRQDQGDVYISISGLDIFNAPQDWKALFGNLVREVNDGTIP